MCVQLCSCPYLDAAVFAREKELHCFGKGKVLSWHFGVAQSDELTQVGDGQSGPQLALNAVLAREDSLGLRIADQHTEAG